MRALAKRVSFGMAYGWNSREDLALKILEIAVEIAKAHLRQEVQPVESTEGDPR